MNLCLDLRALRQVYGERGVVVRFLVLDLL